MWNQRVRAAWRWATARPPTAYLTAAWCVFALYAFPGVMTMDSFDQLREGREWLFTDMHPPAMAALWGVVDRFVSGPFGMLAIQSVTFLAGMYVVLCRAMRPRRAAVVAGALLLFPPVLAPMAVIWKDCQMAGLLVLGVAALLAERRRVRFVGLALVTLATAMRYNAPAATLPLVVLLLDAGAGRGWRRYAIATGAWIATWTIAFGANALLVDRKMYFWSSTNAIHDIVGTIAHVDDDLSDDDLRPELAPTGILVADHYQARIRDIYQSFDFQPLLTGDHHLWDLPISGTTPAPEAQRDAIDRAWRDIITAHLGAYVRDRLAVFAEALGLSSRPVNQAVITHRQQYVGMLEYMSLAGGWSRFQAIGERVAVFVAKKTPLFRPHLYVLLAIALVFAGRRDRDALALLLSGLLLEGSLLPFVLTPDYRYSHWMVVCTCLAAAMLIARRLRSGRSPSTAPSA